MQYENGQSHLQHCLCKVSGTNAPEDTEELCISLLTLPGRRPGLRRHIRNNGKNYANQPFNFTGSQTRPQKAQEITSISLLLHRVTDPDTDGGGLQTRHNVGVNVGGYVGVNAKGYVGDDVYSRCPLRSGGFATRLHPVAGLQPASYLFVPRSKTVSTAGMRIQSTATEEMPHFCGVTSNKASGFHNCGGAGMRHLLR